MAAVAPAPTASLPSRAARWTAPPIEYKEVAKCPAQLSALFLFLLNTLGLLLHSQLIPRGRIRAGMFCFYTNQSNLLLTVYELLLFCAGFYPGGGLWAALTDVRVSCAMALCIWVTHLIYQFVLVPYEKRKGLKFADFGGNFGNLCVHYFTPLLAVMQWLLFAPKENLSILCAVWWLILPLSYTVFALLRASGESPSATRACSTPTLSWTCNAWAGENSCATPQCFWSYSSSWAAC
ncbi:MAG: Pr6Pr family membrane protein [Oscillospiraceae bacterium]